MRPEVKLRDTHFSHASVAGSPNRQTRASFFDWYRGDDHRRVTVFSDSSLGEVDCVQSDFKVAWMLESPLVAKRAYSRIRLVYDKFDHVMTFDRRLLSLDDRFVFSPFGGCWIDADDRQVHEKSELVSIIASRKRRTVGQRMRHRAIRSGGRIFDGHTFGHGYRELQDKVNGLRPYRYSVVIENASVDCYFTEKLIDALVTGTVPIYWGCPSIGDFFDLDGIIQFSDVREVSEILASLSEADYERRRSAIERNLVVAQQYAVVEDNLWRSCLRGLVQQP